MNEGTGSGCRTGNGMGTKSEDRVIRDGLY